MEITAILKEQREFFERGGTLNVSDRVQNLKKLLKMIEDNEREIEEAVKADLGKSAIETYMCEIGLAKHEIKYLIKHIKSFAKPKRVRGTLVNFPSRSYSMPCAKGVVLIMSPWNYPFMLSILPLADAISAGCTVVLKPSNYSLETSKLLSKILGETFDECLVGVVLGGREQNQDLLKQKFDHIFFTGSKAVGHEVLRCAEPNLTTVTLELGGKSPCIVDNNCDIVLTAKRIVFGKFINAGQTCVAPNYVLCDRRIADALENALVCEIKAQYGEKDYSRIGKIISSKHFNRLSELLANEEIIYGGETNEAELKILPTIVRTQNLDSRILSEEIFGPILPVVSYESENEAMQIISKNPTPLALYVFSNDKEFQDKFLTSVSFGGGCVNDTIMHIVSPNLAFGGVGESGMGAYHGRRGFETFTHYKSILKKSLKLDIPLRYQPFDEKKEKIIKKFM